MAIQINEDPRKLALLERIAVGIETVAIALGGADTGEIEAAIADLRKHRENLKQAFPAAAGTTPPQ